MVHIASDEEVDPELQKPGKNKLNTRDVMISLFYFDLIDCHNLFDVSIRYPVSRPYAWVKYTIPSNLSYKGPKEYFNI